MSYRRAIEQFRPVRYPKQIIQEKVQSFLTEGTPPIQFPKDIFKIIFISYHKQQGEKNIELEKLFN